MPESLPHYFLAQWIEPTDREIEVDLCVYGGTAAGVIAAVTAAGHGKRTALLHPGTHLGGMTTGGLGETDFGDKGAIGGMSRQFYRDLGEHYGQDEVWKFEPHAAAAILAGYIRDAEVPVYDRQFLAGVELESARASTSGHANTHANAPAISRIHLLGGMSVRASMFIDATYEGDLLAKAGVSHTIGREANSVYGETVNGVQVSTNHQFASPVDPYREPGNPRSGTLDYINHQDTPPNGSGDQRIQAYCFRVCMCEDPANKVPWHQPEGYDPADYELAKRWFNSPDKGGNEQIRSDGELQKFDRLFVKTKTDTNNHGAVSSDFIGANYGWPEADYAQRERIFQAHRRYQQGLYYFLANDPSVPQRYRDAYSNWGLAADEYKDTGHWPHTLYVREARRMVSDHVVTEHDAQHRTKADDPVAMGSYTIDSHNAQRFVRDGHVLNEGNVQVKPAGPYGISFRSIIPRRGEVSNLLVPVCFSASHVAYGTARMEPVFMVMGESAALAASLALDAKTTVQDLPYAQLRPALERANQVVEL